MPSKTTSPKPASQEFSNQDVPDKHSPGDTSEDNLESTFENMSAGTPPPMSIGAAPSFSLFRAPIRNVHPFKTTNLVEVYQAIRSESYRKRTGRLREISLPSEARQFKSMCFDYVTFSGEFSSRCDKNLIRHSGLMTLDFDHVDNVSRLRESLLHDIFLETEMLFVSPSGEGLKWIVAIDLTETSHQEFFNAVAIYILHYYGIEIDKSGRDISRACYLPYDPEVFIHPKYLK